MKEKEFTEQINVDQIPWNRLLTVYGRATEFPNYIYKLLSHNIKDQEKTIKDIDLMLIHQDTVMPVVPFALIILYKSLKRIPLFHP